MTLTSAFMCMALNLYFESRGEPDLGMRLVAQATMNRAKHDKSQVCAAVLAPNQFAWTRKRVLNRKLSQEHEPKEQDKWEQSQRISNLALNGSINVGDKWRNVTHFHNIDATPYWANTQSEHAI